MLMIIVYPSLCISPWDPLHQGSSIQIFKTVVPIFTLILSSLANTVRRGPTVMTSFEVLKFVVKWIPTSFYPPRFNREIDSVCAST